VSNYANVFGNSEASRTPIHVRALDCPPTSKLEPLWLEAQSVETAALVPCVASLPVGWSLGDVFVNSGRSIVTFDHDRAGRRALEVRLTRRCDVRGAAEVDPRVPDGRRYVRSAGAGALVDETAYDVFGGGCITTRLRVRSTVPEVLSEVKAGAASVVGYASRIGLAQALEERSDGRLHLDPRP